MVDCNQLWCQSI